MRTIATAPISNAEFAEAERQICRLAKNIAHRPGFSRCEQPDIENELWAKLTQSWRHFDRGRASWPAFVATVIGRLSKHYAVRQLYRWWPAKPGPWGGRYPTLSSPPTAAQIVLVWWTAPPRMPRDPPSNAWRPAG